MFIEKPSSIQLSSAIIDPIDDELSQSMLEAENRPIGALLWLLYRLHEKNQALGGQVFHNNIAILNKRLKANQEATFSLIQKQVQIQLKLLAHQKTAGVGEVIQEVISAAITAFVVVNTSSVVLAFAAAVSGLFKAARAMINLSADLPYRSKELVNYINNTLTAVFNRCGIAADDVRAVTAIVTETLIPLLSLSVLIATNNSAYPIARSLAGVAQAGAHLLGAVSSIWEINIQKDLAENNYHTKVLSAKRDSIQESLKLLQKRTVKHQQLLSENIIPNIFEALNAPNLAVERIIRSM